MKNSACRQELWDSGFHLTLGVLTYDGTNTGAGRIKGRSARSIACLSKGPARTGMVSTALITNASRIATT
jgi:hypothetical protein